MTGTIQLKEDDQSNIDPVDYHVGQNVRKFRRMRNMSQSDLSEIIGVSYQQIQKYETGKNRISASVLYKFAHLFEVDVQAFFDGLTPESIDLKEGELNPYEQQQADELLATFFDIRNPTVRSKALQIIRLLSNSPSV